MSSENPAISETSKAGIPREVQQQVAALGMKSLIAQGVQPGETSRKVGEVEHNGQSVAAHIVPGTNAIFTDGKRVLLGSRDGKSPTSSAQFPGGMLDAADRGAADGALRELTEETGVVAPAGKIDVKVVGEPDINKPTSVREAKKKLDGRAINEGDFFIVAGQPVVVQTDPDSFDQATPSARGQDDLAWAGVVNIADIAQDPSNAAPGEVVVRPQDINALKEAGLIIKSAKGSNSTPAQIPGEQRDSRPNPGDRGR